MKSGGKTVISAASIYLALVLAWSWPLPLHVANRFTHDPGDPLLNAYLIWWNAHAVPLTASYWNAPYYWPMHGALALTEHFAGLSPISTPLQWLGASPLATANILLIASTWWAALAAHALLRRLGGSQLAAYCTGIAFAYAPYRTSQIGHLQLYACWWLPLMLLSLHGYCDDRRARWLWLLGASWALQGLTNGYFLLFTPVLIVCWLAWFTRRPDGSRAVAVLGTLAVAAVPVLPFLLKYRAVQQAQGLARTPDEMVMFSARLGSFVSAHPMLRFWHTPPPATTEQYLFPGVTAVAIVIAGAILAPSARRDRRFLFYTFAAVLMTLLCTGPAPERSIAALWQPYTWLTWLPGYGGLRVPSRFFMLAVLCLAVAAGLAFDALRVRLSRGRRLLAIAVFAGLAHDGAIAGMPLGVPPPRLNLHESGAVVLVLPFEDGRASVAAMYQSMSHRMPVVNGYAGYIPSHAYAIEWALHRGDASVLTELRRGHPLYVVVASGEDEDRWTAFMERQPDARMLGVQGGGRVYRLPAAPYGREPRAGTVIDNVGFSSDPGWLIADLHATRPVRGLELRTHGALHPVPDELVVQISMDGRDWTTVFDERPGGLVLAGALAQPQTGPLRIELFDVAARYVRLDTPAFSDCVIFRP
ncbi:MAG TPA: discoidin domain-containing protein [Vicinamibacterales bacterium]